MKFKPLYILGFAGFAMSILTGCGKSDEPVNPTPAPSPEIVIPTIEWDESDYICKGGSYGGYFSDVNVERILCTDTTYEFWFESSHATNKSYSLSISDESIAVAVKREGDGKMFDLTCKAQGDVIMTIENADGILIYRNIVRIRDAIALDKMNDYLLRTDKFETLRELSAYLGDFKLSFDYLEEFDNQFLGTLKGGDDMDRNVTIVFSMEYEEYIPNQDCYSYILTTVYTTTEVTTVGYLSIARAGDWLYLYEADTVEGGGLLTMLVPTVLK